MDKVTDATIAGVGSGLTILDVIPQGKIMYIIYVDGSNNLNVTWKELEYSTAVFATLATGVTVP